MAISTPQHMLHPGEVLAEYYMKETGMSQTELARQMGTNPRKINEIVNGKRAISPEFALDLLEVIGTTAEMWTRMQADYDLWKARQKRASRRYTS
jgi:addiction module HigA family antidote